MTAPLDLARLVEPIVDDPLHLDQLGEAHREGLRAACNADRDIWEIFPNCWFGDAFDPQFDAVMADANRQPFALSAGGVLIGMSGWLNIAPARQTLEIGGTYIAPEARGTGVNGRIKHLLIERALACDVRRIEFRIDTRNTRSCRAIEKLGAVCEGVLRQERVTWTGHVRDAALYAILADDWRAAHPLSAGSAT